MHEIAVLNTYFKIIKNFISTKKAEVFVLAFIFILLAAVLQLNFLEVLKKYPRYTMFIASTVAAIYVSWLVVVFLNKDQEALRRNHLNNKQLFKVRFIESLAVLSLAIMLNHFVYLFRGLIGFKVFVIQFFVLLLSSFLFSVMIVFKSSGKIIAKPSRTLFCAFAKHSKIKTMVAFWTTSFWRQDKLIICGSVVLILISFFIGYISFLNHSKLSGPLFQAVPLCILLFLALDSNCLPYIDLLKYQKNYQYIYLVDFFCWSLITLMTNLGIILFMFYLSVPFQTFYVFISPFIILYVLLVKFSYLRSAFMRYFILLFSLSVPILAPVFAFLGVRRLFYDKS